MKVIVMSDSHGSYENVKNITGRYENADLFIHLGDGEGDIMLLQGEKPEIMNKLIFAGGNCDSGFHSRSVQREIGGVKVLITHGDEHRVRYGTGVISAAARIAGCKAVFFGHTHKSLIKEENGVFLLNPGSCGGENASFAVVTAQDGKISADIEFV